MRSRSGVVVVYRGAYGDAMVGPLKAIAPEETFVSAASEEEVPAEADVLVTLLDESEAIRSVMGSSVRWVHVLGAGVDRFPFDALGDRALTCSRGAAAPAISEWVLAVMLAFVKQLPDSFVDSPPPRWNLASLGSLEGGTLGLVGLGAIGTAVARRALAFDMRVVANRRKEEPASLSGVELVGLDELFSVSDHVVIAAPATSETHHMIGREVLSSCKAGLHLVNIARGSLVDQDALREALDSGLVARASLDTVEPEPLPEGHWMYSHPGVRLSPHISWSSPVTMTRTFEIFVDNLRRYRRGEPLKGLVDPVAGY